MKRPTEWLKIFANDATEMGLISKICGNSYNSISKTNNAIKNEKTQIRHFSKEDIVCVLVTQSSPILFDCKDCSPSGSSDHGILQARIPEWVATSFSKRRHADGQKMFHFTDYQRRTNNCNEVSPHTDQNSHHQKSRDKYWREKGIHTVGKNESWCSSYGKQYGGSLKK